MKFNDRLRELRKGKGLTQDEFSKQSGLTRSAISMYERGEREPNFETLEKLADFFNVDMNYLLGKSDKTTYIPKGAFVPKWKRVPMMGYAAAGSPLEDLNQDTPYINVEGKYDVDFCITIRGDSMVDIGINDGDIVFVKSTPTVENGQVAVVEIDNEKICLKRFYKSGDTITLVSANPKYAPMVFNQSNCENVRILGRAVIKQAEIK